MLQFRPTYTCDAVISTLLLESLSRTDPCPHSLKILVIIVALSFFPLKSIRRKGKFCYELSKLPTAVSDTRRLAFDQAVNTQSIFTFNSSNRFSQNGDHNLLLKYNSVMDRNNRFSFTTYQRYGTDRLGCRLSTNDTSLSTCDSTD